MTAVWVCQVRREAFVGGESQRCRHAKTCDTCGGSGKTAFIVKGDEIEFTGEPCAACNGTGQVSGCGVMELIGGEPVEWCVVHASPQVRVSPTNCQMLIEPLEGEDDPCQFESNVRVGP